MIVCSYNFFSDVQVRAVIAGSVERPRMSQIYSSLGCAAQCGRCAHTIKSMITDLLQHATPLEALRQTPQMAIHQV